MKRFVAIALFVSGICSLGFAQVPAALFANRYGGSGSDYNYALRTYPDGRVVFTGVFASSVTLGGQTYNSQGGGDAFICQADSLGNVLWAKVFGGPGEQLLSQVSIDPQGNIGLVGEFTGSSTFAGISIPLTGDKGGLVARLDADGNLLFTSIITNSNNVDFNEVAVDGSGNVYAFGEFEGSLTFGDSTLTSNGTFNGDLLLVKYSPQGNVLWAKRFGTASSETPLAIWVSSAGECVISGTFLGIFSAGLSTHTSSGLSDIFVVKLGVNGTPLWSTAYGGTQTDNAFGMDGDAAGNIFITGCYMKTMVVGANTLTSNGLWDVFALKLSSSGAVQWCKGFGGTSNDRSNDIRVGPGGSLYMYGWYQNKMGVGTDTLQSNGEYDVFLIKLAENGVQESAFSFGGGSYDVGAAIDLDQHGNIYASGDYWSSNFLIGSTSLAAPVSGNDIFIIRFGALFTQNKKGQTAHFYTPKLVFRRNGYFEVATEVDGDLQLFNTLGQELFRGKTHGRIPVVFQTSENVVLFRFISEAGVQAGRWLTAGP